MGPIFVNEIKCSNKGLWITSDDRNKQVTLPAYPITRVGKEILKLGRFSANLEYLTALGGQIKNMECKVLLGDWEVVGSGFRVRNGVEL